MIIEESKFRFKEGYLNIPQGTVAKVDYILGNLPIKKRVGFSFKRDGLNEFFEAPIVKIESLIEQFKED